MKVVDFRFRPNTPEIINGIKNSTMFKAACEVIGFDQRKPQPLDEIVADLDAMGVELGVITGRDAETTYGFPANNNSVLEFCRAYPNKFVGLWGIVPLKKMAAVREIEKVVNVVRKRSQLPVYTVLVIDATTGQNGLQQAREFSEVADVSGIVLTKLDGTAKGGIAVAIMDELKLPVLYIGVGEGIEDLQAFDANAFVDAIF